MAKLAANEKGRDVLDLLRFILKFPVFRTNFVTEEGGLKCTLLANFFESCSPAYRTKFHVRRIFNKPLTPATPPP